jgi:molybdate transport system substrate-binding protein
MRNPPPKRFMSLHVSPVLLGIYLCLGVAFLTIGLFVGIKRPVPLRIGSASSLEEPLRAMSLPIQQTSERVPQMIFASSAQLAAQQRAGAGYDIVLLADADLATEFEQRERAILFIGNRLVVAKRPHVEVAELQDLAALDRVAIAAPGGPPLGRYTEQALEAAGVSLGDGTVFAPTATRTLWHLTHGDADAAIVFASQLRQQHPRAEVTVEIDPATHDPIVYVAVALSDDPAVDQVIDWLTSDEAKAMLLEHGFSPLPGEREP